MLESVFLTLDLSNNLQYHLSDIATGWGFESVQNIAYILFPMAETSIEIRISGIFVCDCGDYLFLKTFREFEFRRHFDILEEIRCENEFNVDSTPLIYVVCNVTERCPEECECIQRPDNATFRVECSGTGLRFPPLQVPPSANSE